MCQSHRLRPSICLPPGLRDDTLTPIDQPAAWSWAWQKSIVSAAVGFMAMPLLRDCRREIRRRAGELRGRPLS
jgi:hypothetical protein